EHQTVDRAGEVGDGRMREVDVRAVEVVVLRDFLPALDPLRLAYGIAHVVELGERLVAELDPEGSLAVLGRREQTDGTAQTLRGLVVATVWGQGAAALGVKGRDLDRHARLR